MTERVHYRQETPALTRLTEIRYREHNRIYDSPGRTLLGLQNHIFVYDDEGRCLWKFTSINHFAWDTGCANRYALICSSPTMRAWLTGEAKQRSPAPTSTTWNRS